jgi:hypothetical protein
VIGGSSLQFSEPSSPAGSADETVIRTQRISSACPVHDVDVGSANIACVRITSEWNHLDARRDPRQLIRRAVRPRAINSD